MRCLIDARVLTDPHPGGITRVARTLIQEMIEQASPKDTFTLLTSGIKSQNIDHRAQLGSPFPKTELSSAHIPLPNKLIALTTFLNLTSIDRLYTRYSIPDTRYAQPNVLFLPNLEMVGKPRLPYALLIHDLSFYLEPRWFSSKSRLWHHVSRARTLIEEANALFTVSDHTKQDLVDHFRADQQKIQTLPIQVPPLPRENEELPLELKNTQYFLILGANDPRKNVACVIEAFQEFLKRSPDKNIKLVLIGSPPHTRYSILDTQYFFVSRPSDALLSTLMRHASALLYPSWYEGFGLPLHEAHAYGTPIIASTSGALPETAPLGTLFVPPFKPHLWAQAMELILKQPRKAPSPSPKIHSLEAGEMILKTLHLIADKKR